MEEKFKQIVKIFNDRTKKDCYSIELIEEVPSILDNKIGGVPYLPIGEVYPQDKTGNNLALLLQINLKDIELEGYPKKGILEIFTDVNLDYPCQYEIRYFEENLNYQTDLPDLNLSNYIVEKGYKIDLKKDTCCMPINDYRFIKTFSSIINEMYGTKIKYYADIEEFFGDFDWYDEFLKQVNNPFITIGGYADFVQEDPRYDMKEKRDECLFKIDSCGDYNKISIGDSGILFTLISKENINKCNFKEAIVDWDCC